MNDTELTTQQKFERELAPISFLELQKFFASGMMIVVSQRLSVIEVAMNLHEDNVETIQRWMNEESIVRAHDDHAKQWVANQTKFNAVTVAPWVLVQEIRNEE